MRKLGIDFISGFSMPPTALARLAADLGCASISAVLEPPPFNPEKYPDWSLRTDKALRRELIATLKDHGLVLALAEGMFVMPGLDVGAYAQDLDIMAELGAERVSAISFDPDLARSFDQFAKAAEMAAERSLATVTEFAPCFTVTDLPTALAAVLHVGRADFRITLDTMHLFRSGGTAADVAALDPELIGYVQLCDVPTEPALPEYMDEGMYERLAPGEGDVPLVDVLRVLPPDVPISIEIPQRAKAEAGQRPEERIAHCIAAARRVMEEAKAEVA